MEAVINLKGKSAAKGHGAGVGLCSPLLTPYLAVFLVPAVS